MFVPEAFFRGFKHLAALYTLRIMHCAEYFVRSAARRAIAVSLRCLLRERHSTAGSR